jgi:4-amino-4-deoxy-L-arabinose transferase-like glycosyltransferase
MMSTLRWPGAAFALIASFVCALAFVGLSASSYWTDELFTLWVVHHADGFGEVWRRALTDVHPPFYYLLLYAWTRLAGFSELAMRLPSALFAVTAVGVFALAARRVASRNAVAFACAAAVLSSFWFDQSQNARNYGLCLLLSSALLYVALWLHRHLRERPAHYPLLPLAALAALGLAGSFTHAYLLLAFGCLLLYLLCSERSLPLRATVIAIGLVVLALNAAYFHALTQNTHLDLNQLWFKNDGRFFGSQFRKAVKDAVGRPVLLAILALVLVRVFRRTAPAAPGDEAPDARWATRLGAFVPVGTAVCGIGVSLLVAPSFSGRNLLVAAPFVWLLFARCFDLIGPLRSPRDAALVSAALLLIMLPDLKLQQGRWLPRNQEWRASAEFVRETPGCAGETLPVVFPYRFGPTTPALRDLVERHFFGFYASGAGRLDAYPPAEFARAAPESAPLQAELAARIREAAGGGCPVLAWGVHDLLEEDAIRLGAELARQAGVAPRSVVVREFDHFERRGQRWRRKPGAYVFLLGTDPSAEPLVTAAPYPFPSRGAGGSDVVVRNLYTYDGLDAASAYMIDGYSVQRRLASGATQESSLVVRRAACDAPVRLAEDSAWPDPAAADCIASPADGRALRADAAPPPSLPCIDGGMAGLTFEPRACLSSAGGDWRGAPLKVK